MKISDVKKNASLAINILLTSWNVIKNILIDISRYLPTIATVGVVGATAVSIGYQLDTQSQVNHVKSVISNDRIELEKAKSSQDEFKKQSEELNKKTEELKAKSNEAKSETTQLNNSLVEVKNKTIKALTDLSEVQMRIDEAKTKLTSLDDQSSKTISELNNATTELSTIKQNLIAQIDAIKADVMNLGEYLANNTNTDQANNESLLLEIKNLNTSISNLNVSLNEINNNISLQSDRITNIENSNVIYSGTFNTNVDGYITINYPTTLNKVPIILFNVVSGNNVTCNLTSVTQSNFTIRCTAYGFYYLGNLNVTYSIKQ